MSSPDQLRAKEAEASVGPWSKETSNVPLVKPLPMEENVVTEMALPHYALPCITSMLPGYANSEQDLVHRTFHTGNYDMLRHLPEFISTQEVMNTRRCRIDGVHTLAAPMFSNTGQRKTTSGKAPNALGLFKEFEYMPSRYSLVDELRSKERAQSNALRAQISGKDFQSVGIVHKGKYEDGFEPGVPYPYLSDPYEAMEEKKLLEKWEHESLNIHEPFTPSGYGKLPEAPTKIMEDEVLIKLRSSILQDWEGANMLMYHNDDGKWVMRFDLSSIESESGLSAYMNIFIRCNSLVNKYNLAKVTENWGVKPGDGNIYFTVKPPWVHHDPVESFFTLHPEERSFKTIQAFKLLLSQEGKKKSTHNTLWAL